MLFTAVGAWLFQGTVCRLMSSTTLPALVVVLYPCCSLCDVSFAKFTARVEVMLLAFAERAVRLKAFPFLDLYLFFVCLQWQSS